MMMHNHTKFHEERLGGGEDMSGQVFPEDLDPLCNIDLEDSNLKLPHNILVCDGAPLHQIFVANGSKIQEI